MFDLDKFKTGKYYVHLPTQELYDEVMEFLDKNGVVWAWSRKNLKTKTYWDKYKEKTAIDCVDDGIKYGRKSYYERQAQFKELKIKKEENTMKLEEFIKKHGNANVDEKELKKLLGIKSEKYFIPKEEDAYWFVTYTGNVTSETHSNWDTDIKICENNEVFRTREEAEEHAKKQRFLLQMKRDFLDNTEEMDWKNSTQFKYYLIYVHNFEVVEISTCYSQQYSGFYTTNKEWLENYANLHEEEIKKYYFEVK